MNLLDAALRYASHGVYVFPLDVKIVSGDDGEREKKCYPLPDWDAHSTIDPARIRDWFGPSGRYRNASIAMDCDKSHKVVVDADSKDKKPDAPDGVGNWETFLAEHNIGATWCAATPSSGLHSFYQADPQHPVHNSASLLAPGIDIRGVRSGDGKTGGFIILPPSRDERGKYHWLEGEPEWDQLPVVPLALVKTIDAVRAAKRESRKSKQGSATSSTGRPRGAARRFTQEQAVEFCRPAMDDLKAAAKGARNEMLNTAAKTLSHFVPAFWSQAEAETWLYKALDPTYPRDEAAGTIDSAFGSAAGDWVAEKVTPASAPEDWDTPMPLGHQPGLLPVDALGPVAGPMVDAVARSYQVPVDLAITMVLPLVTTAARGQWKVRVSTDWVESLTLCTVAVAPSGERKSPVNRALAAALHQYEQVAQADAAPRIARQKARHDLKAKQLDKLRNTAAHSGSVIDEGHYLDAAERLAEDVVEHPPRWVTDDATPEAIVRLLSEQGGAIGAISAEAGLFGIMAGRYSSGNPNLEVVLQATAGDRITVDRKGSEPINIPNPALSLGLALQPGLLPDLAKASFRHSGLLARFLWALPEPRVGTRTTEESPVPDEVAMCWNKHLVGLAATAHKRWTTGRDQPAGQSFAQPRSPGPAMLTLTAAARCTLDEFRAELEPRLHPKTGDLAGIGDWGSKLPGQVVRIAAALTLLGDPEATVVEAPTLADAARLGRAYIGHAMATLAQIHNNAGSAQPAIEVLGWVTQQKAPTFSLRDVHRALRGRSWATDADAVRDALATLVDYGHVRAVEEPREGKAGRPSQRYELHPCHLVEAERRAA